MRKFIIIGCFFYNWLLSAQDFSGQWHGVLTQPGKTDTFFYDLKLSQKGASFSGTSFSKSKDGKSQASFVITGVWDGKQLVLQEIEQSEPKQPRWCLKYAILQYRIQGNIEQLEGSWKADGCTPGSLFLQRKGMLKTVEKEEPFTWTGRWSGQLSQSDRDYGFYFEVNIKNSGAGESYIVSEDNGGSAKHYLQWNMNKHDSSLVIKELEVFSKTDAKWKWCIKSYNLRLRYKSSVTILEGDWQGFLEGYTEKTGKCASGKIYLEKPIEIRKMQVMEQQNKPYQQENQREVRVSRIVEVEKPTIRIKVWDSGTVDGDIVTLFLNGKQILEKHRVNKSKLSIPVTLAEDNNFLILHAEDLGNIPPNTIAVSVDDGTKEQILVLSSDLKVSGAILIKQFSIKK